VTNLGNIIEGYGVNTDNIAPWMAESRKAAGVK
jgi:hypothetical protein